MKGGAIKFFVQGRNGTNIGVHLPLLLDREGIF